MHGRLTELAKLCCKNNSPLKHCLFGKSSFHASASTIQVKLGVCLLQINRFGGLNHFIAGVKEDHKHISALTNMGFVEVNFGNLTEAEELLP